LTILEEKQWDIAEDNDDNLSGDGEVSEQHDSNVVKMYTSCDDDDDDDNDDDPLDEPVLLDRELASPHLNSLNRCFPSSRPAL
jgi:hypothetical protein